jgi:hypothetical protein
MVQKSIGGTVGNEQRGVFAMVAGVGPEVPIIVGVSKRPLVSQCFGELVRDEWPMFFYSLRFKNWNRPASDGATKAKLAGEWTVATGSVADRFTFAPNGRYASAAAAMYRSRVSPTEVLQTTQAFFGDGAYTVRGNVLTLKADKGQARGGPFRVEQESKDGVNWTERLCVKFADITGDLCYKKTR